MRAKCETSSMGINNHAIHQRGPAELFQVAKDALRAEALVVVIEERGNREAEWDTGS